MFTSSAASHAYGVPEASMEDSTTMKRNQTLNQTVTYSLLKVSQYHRPLALQSSIVRVNLRLVVTLYITVSRHWANEAGSISSGITVKLNNSANNNMLLSLHHFANDCQQLPSCWEFLEPYFVTEKGKADRVLQSPFCYLSFLFFSFRN